MWEAVTIILWLLLLISSSSAAAETKNRAKTIQWTILEITREKKWKVIIQFGEIWIKVKNDRIYSLELFLYFLSVAKEYCTISINCIQCMLNSFLNILHFTLIYLSKYVYTFIFVICIEHQWIHYIFNLKLLKHEKFSPKCQFSLKANQIGELLEMHGSIFRLFIFPRH